MIDNKTRPGIDSLAMITDFQRCFIRKRTLQEPSNGQHPADTGGAFPGTACYSAWDWSKREVVFGVMIDTDSFNSGHASLRVNHLLKFGKGLNGDMAENKVTL